MTPPDVALLAVLIFGAACLYSSVGHAGASGYLAAMALFGLAPAVMKPSALTLNILVAAIATVKFCRAGCFSWRLLWPFAVASVPLAFVGGMLHLPGAYYRPVVGVVLLYAAYRMYRASRHADQPGNTRPPQMVAAILAGGAIGLLSGLTGVGGGIFLSSLLLFMGWAETKQTSGVSAVFILVNSIAGLGGHLSSMPQLPTALPFWAVAAAAGGWLGSEYGSRRLASGTVQLLLALVLVIAGLKLALT